MSLWSRLTGVFRSAQLNREIDEELASHLEEAIKQGREPAEARTALGSPLRILEESRDIRLIPWLDSLRADAVFGWRQLWKRKVTSVAAILSLGLGIGACMSAFRLIDAILLRPLPVSHPEQLHQVELQGLDPQGKLATADSFAYPAFRLMRAAVKDQAELLAVSYATRKDLTFKSDAEMERAYVQYVSGWTFSTLGLRPAAGRLLTENDDRKPGAHPYAVLSHSYWKRRFNQDPAIVGRTLRMGDDLYTIAGVLAGDFTGTERGVESEIFVPTMMFPAVTHDDWTWIRILARVKPGVSLEPLRAELYATWRGFEEERAKGFTGMSKEDIEKFLDLKLILESAAAGASDMQRDYRVPLIALSVLVALVLLIACANVANLMTAQAAARAREMALRVSIGAGRGRLMQLVLVESAILAVFAAAIGGLFAWWSAPVVVGMINPPDNPARLPLPMDWHVLGFALLLTIAVMLLFGLTPALHASAVKPASALKGGADPHARRRLMQGLIAAQVAFCFLVLFVGSLFTATFARLSHRPIGFSPQHLLAIETAAQRDQAPVVWDQLIQHLRDMPGIESAGIAGWPLLDGNAWNGFISVNGAPPGPELAYFLSVSPGWLDTMKISRINGRDFRQNDVSPAVAIINETFARQFLPGVDPIGKVFAKNGEPRCQVIGVVRDVPYKDIHEPILPTVFVPIRRVDGHGAVQSIREATILVRVSSDNWKPLAAILRREVPRARSEFRVSNIRSYQEMIDAQTVRERLLALIGAFFAGVALLLAGIGLYGVLDYSVLQRRREIGIRMAIGAQSGRIARLVTGEVFAMVAMGAMVGVVLGMTSVHYIQALLFETRAGDPMMLALPSLTIVAAALLAALPAVIHAVRIDPAAMLRAD